VQRKSYVDCGNDSKLFNLILGFSLFFKSWRGRSNEAHPEQVHEHDLHGHVEHVLQVNDIVLIRY